MVAYNVFIIARYCNEKIKFKLPCNNYNNLYILMEIITGQKVKFPTEGNVHDRAKFPVLVQEILSIMYIFFSMKFSFRLPCIFFQQQYDTFNMDITITLCKASPYHTSIRINNINLPMYDANLYFSWHYYSCVSRN